MLALALAHSPDDNRRNEAVQRYECLLRDGLADAQDYGNLAVLLSNLTRHDEAKAVVLRAIANSPSERLGYLEEIGKRLVGQTGDREFRKQLETAIAERGSHE
jgi:hypothetical protein